MQLPDECIKELQVLWKQEYAKDFTFEEAREAAQRLLGFFQVLDSINRRLRKEGRASLSDAP